MKQSMGGIYMFNFIILFKHIIKKSVLGDTGKSFLFELSFSHTE